MKFFCKYLYTTLSLFFNYPKLFYRNKVQFSHNTCISPHLFFHSLIENVSASCPGPTKARPNALNAISSEVWDDLPCQIEIEEKSDHCCVVILREIDREKERDRKRDIECVWEREKVREIKRVNERLRKIHREEEKE